MAAKKADKAPLVRCNGTMSESQYLAWIRSALRSKSLKWLPRASALQLARRPYKGPNKLQKWEFCCSICQGWFKAKEVVVDHYPVSAGSILSVEDIGQFASNLFCEVDNLRVLCSEDHDIYTLADKRGISFEEARHEKRVLAICKLPAKELLAFLSKHGYDGDLVSNKSKREKLVQEILTKGKCDGKV